VLAGRKARNGVGVLCHVSIVFYVKYLMCFMSSFYCVRLCDWWSEAAVGGYGGTVCAGRALGE